MENHASQLSETLESWQMKGICKNPSNMFLSDTNLKNMSEMNFSPAFSGPPLLNRGFHFEYQVFHLVDEVTKGCTVVLEMDAVYRATV